MTKDELKFIEKEVLDELEASVEFARKSPFPKKEDAMDFIYS